MFTQPSTNQIASTYAVNTAPLARKVDQDKKQNGGIPKDLRQLMALNDIAEGKQHLGINQALQIPTNMPTVAQATQQQAQQAIQARMMQMAREQQRLQQKPPIIPPGTPQPEEQPQGIDTLETNTGDAYAEGGIIGFDGTKSSFVKDLGAFADRLKGAFTETEEEKAARKLQQQIQQEGAPIGYFTKGSEDYDKKSALRTFIGENPTVVKNPAFQADPVAFMEKTKNVNTAQEVNVGKSSYVPNAQADAMETNKLFNLAATPSAEAVAPTNVSAPKPPRPSTTQQTQATTRVNADSAPMPGGLKDLAGIPSMGAGRAYERDRLREDPAKAMADLKALYDKEVGARDLSIYDKTSAELEARKQKIAQQRAPKSGFEGLMEYLDNVAEAGGKTWYDAGSRGGALQKKKRLTLEEQENALMDKILELGAKKTDAQYAEKKGMFDLTQAEKTRIITDKRAIAQSLGLSEDKERELIQTALENEKNRLNDLKKAGISASAGNRDDLLGRALLIKKDNPTISIEEAIKRAAVATYAGQAGVAEGKNDAATEKEIAKIRAGYAKTMKFLSPDSPLYKRQQAMMEQDVADARRTGGGGSGLPDAAPAKKPEGVTVTKIGS
jgi:hypothetical protein